MSRPSASAGGLYRIDLGTVDKPRFSPAAGRYTTQQIVTIRTETDGALIHYRIRDDLRGGPMMSFKFYPPRAGFLRLFCQVVVDGKTIFAPFNVNVAP